MSLTLKSTIRLSSGYQIPTLGFGVFQNYDARPSVLQALEAGYRHIDCAQAYRNEEAVGKAVSESSVPREDIFYTTKIMSTNHGYEKTLQNVDISLKRFGGGYIDLFLIHDPYAGTEKRLATYKALQEARKAGKIKSVGVSNYGVHHLEEIRAAGYETPAVNQIELHPFCQQKPIVEYCKENNIVIEAYAPIIQNKKGLIDHPTITGIGRKHSKDNGQILIRWSLQKGFVPLPKSSNPGRIASNADLFDFELDDDDMAKLDSLDRGDRGAVTWNPVNSP